MVAPRIETIGEKKLIGMHLPMTLANNKTFVLWSSFMPRLKEIKNNATADLVSLQVYDANLDFKDFNPSAKFEKWALVEVADFDMVPEGMEPFTLSGGQYAVFIYKGLPQHFAEMFNYIFRTWLPGSEYALDNRPHFEVLGAKYKNNSPDSEEEIWVPIKLKV